MWLEYVLLTKEKSWDSALQMTAMSDVFEAICVRVFRETEQTDKQCLYDVCVLRKREVF